MPRLQAGAASSLITPPVGVDLCGFAGRPAPSEGVHDDLFAKALYLASDDCQVVLITADLIGLSADDVAAIRQIIHRETGIPPDAVMVTCSHTHSGPATHCIRYLGDWDEAYLAVLIRKIAGTAVMAVQRSQPATLGWGRERVCIHVNRREKTPGGLRIGVNPEGMTLPWVDVLAVDSFSGQPLARWFSHAAHAVTLGAENTLISADWPGFAQRSIEGAAPGATALFAQGCCGDLNPNPRGSFEVAERQGWIIAGAAIKGAALAERSGDVAIEYASTTVRLPLQDPPAPSVVREQLEQAQRQFEEEGRKAGYQMRKTLAGYVEWTEQLLDLALRGATSLHIDFEIQAIRIGDRAIVGLPGEVFSEYAVSIAQLSTFPTVVVAYTNGNFGYIPTAHAFAEGGYEVEWAHRFYLPLPLASECEQIILAGARDLLSSMVG
ncbi:MAG: hypothetical protein H5T86_00695 [Armatimonadetes bacterium]|nr:hypothetical protein [Armatimonadota bacterium]